MRALVRGLGRLLAVVLLGAAMLAPAAAAQAHDSLESTNPANGATLEAVPASVVLTFDHTPIGVGTEIQVKDATGINQSDGPANIVDNNVTQPIKPGAPAGAYTVVWRVVSSDSHPIEGTFTFTARAAGGGSAAATTQQPAATATAPATATAAPSSASSPAVPLWIAIGAGAVVLIAALAFVVRRSIRRAAED